MNGNVSIRAEKYWYKAILDLPKLTFPWCLARTQCVPEPHPPHPLPLTREKIFRARAREKEVTFFMVLREMKVVLWKCTLEKYQHCISDIKTHTASFYSPVPNVAN